MKTSTRSRSGFTLVELLVALGITAVIVSMLVTITATALTGYSAARNQVKAAREARAAFDQVSRDLESLVIQSRGNFESLWISSDSAPGPPSNQSPNASRAVFLTAATDRYDGDIGGSSDRGGDISTVGYRLLYRDPVTNSNDPDYSSFVLYRQLINPDETFENLLAKEDLESAYSSYSSNESDSRNFVCENVYQFSLSFNVEYTLDGVITQEKILVISSGGNESIQDFRIRSNGITADNNVDTPYSNGRVISADLSITVINDSALEILRNSRMQENAKNELIEKNSYHFSKTIILPQV